MQKRTPAQRFLVVLNITIMFLILAVGADTLVAQDNLSGRDKNVQQRIKRLEETVNFTPTPTIKPPFDLIPVRKPIKIEIPSIALLGQIIEVGVTKDNVMEVPKDASKIGWFSLGTQPGEIGRSVLTAHYDTTTGKQGIFYNLRELNPGDLMYVTMESGEELLFQVEDVVSHPWKSFPTDLIYGETDKKEMALITCDGVWNPIDRNYSKRLVVFATLWENKTL